MAPPWRAIEPAWRQFGGEQPVPMAPVNLDGFLGATARGDDKQWPDELAYWYGFCRNRLSRDHQIKIVPTRHPGWPSREYTDWWAVACRQRFLTQDRLLQDPRGFQLPGDVPPAASQARDPILLPRDAPARGRRARMQRPDIRRREGGRDQDPGGDGPSTHDTDLDFFSGADIELAQFMEYGGGSGSGSWSQPGDGVPPSHRYGPPSDMYELFSCGEQTMEQIAHGYVAARAADDAVYRPSPPCSLTLTIPSRVRGFNTTSPPHSRSCTPHRSSNISCPRPIARRTNSLHRSRRILRLHGLNHITSPPSAITHHPRSPARRSANPGCQPAGTATSEGSPSAHLRHIIPSPPSAGSRGRPGLVRHAEPYRARCTARSLVSMGCVWTPTFGVPHLSAQTASLLGALNQVHLVPGAGGDRTTPLLASHARVRPYCGAIPLRPQALVRDGRELCPVNTKHEVHAVYGVHKLPPFDARGGAAGQGVSAWVVQRLEFPTVTGALPEPDTE
ncbi:hypothetical protein PIB30_067525 [Stylosanthes scabra]|uniref:Uncharacterized protein n=1 Tax=Stylosanthes scabra TaxID=79078 RepID=A0ABU6YPG8_9FABA|nr:hypothetical protein [Stylosanthes scabra]